MNDPKILFIKQFLATLAQKEYTTIPINNDDFKHGIENMACYFRDNIADFGQYAEKLDVLFVKYSTRGEFTQFAKVIEGFNGRIVSLENPHYVKANIKLQKDYIEELMENVELGIDSRHFRNLAERFVAGAGL